MALKVLIGFAESLAAIESAWCLRAAGYDVVAFTRAGRRPPLAAARGVTVHTVPAPEAGVAACVAAVRSLIAVERPAAVLPLDDAALLVCDRATDAVDGRILGTPVAGATAATARLALDKSEQITRAEKAGIPVPPTGSTEPPTGAGPWIVKSALAAVERDARLTRPAGAIAREPGDVATVVAELGGPALIQPVIEGVGEGVFGIAIGGEAHALSAHRRVRMMNPRGSGSSACRSIPVDPDLVGPVRRFVAEAGWHGIFMIELLRDASGQPWFMELNGRTWGSMALARHRGLPYPAWAVEAALDPTWRPPAVPEAPHLLCRHAGRELVHLLAVLRGARGADAGRWPGRGATLRAMLRRERGTRWYHAAERGVFLRDTWRTVADQLRRR